MMWLALDMPVLVTAPQPQAMMRARRADYVVEAFRFVLRLLVAINTLGVLCLGLKSNK